VVKIVKIEQSNKTVGTSAAVLVAASGDRVGLHVYNLGSVLIYVGKDSSVSSTNGYPIAASTEKVFLDWTDAVYAISGTAGQDVRVIEEFDAE
jgi:hypothetical protein